MASNLMREGNTGYAVEKNERERRASETAEQREVRLRIRRERDRARRASQSVEEREALPSVHQATLYQWTQLDHSNTFTLAKTSIEVTHTTVVTYLYTYLKRLRPSPYLRYGE